MVRPYRRESFVPAIRVSAPSADSGTPSGLAVLYPRFGEGQDGAAHFVPNKVRNA